MQVAFYFVSMSQRIQLSPFCPFGRDVSWLTQDVIEGYIYAWIKGERFGEAFITKYAQADPVRVRTFKETLFDDPDFDDLKSQIWDEMELPEPGTIEYHILQIERTLADPNTPVTEHHKLYKILGEFRGWLIKPGEGKGATVNLSVNNGSVATVVNKADAEQLYHSMLASRT